MTKRKKKLRFRYSCHPCDNIIDMPLAGKKHGFVVREVICVYCGKRMVLEIVKDGQVL